MSNDHALFIIVLPNDFDLATSNSDAGEIIDPIRQDSNTVSASTISALVASAPNPVSLPSSDILSIHRKSEPTTAIISQQPSASHSLCVLLKNYLAERADLDGMWMISENKKSFQVTVYVEFGLVSDRLLHDLAKMSIGKRSGTKVFVLPTTIVLKGEDIGKLDSSVSSLNSIDNNNLLKNELSPIVEEVFNGNQINDSSSSDQTTAHKISKNIRISNFKKSVRARLMVHQVVASIRASSAITFDFVLLIYLASMLAAFGLLENSSVIIVASMLVSPLMNPILGIVFGLSIRDHSLWQRGLRNEIIGLIICIICGFIIGLFTTFSETQWGNSSSFPTSEMRSRGDVKRLWVGVLIALPSGAGVALSVLGGNTGSLVGVAISASLLPPAVNCGLLFAYGCLGTIFSNVAVAQSRISNTLDTNFTLSSNCTGYFNNNYQPLYACHLPVEAVILACCSLLLAIVNIICIVLMALIILRIKEVVPLHQPNKDITKFFHYDVKVVRDYNKTIQANDWNPRNFNALSLRRNYLAHSIVNRWKTFKSPVSSQQNPSSSSENVDVESHAHINNLSSTDNETRRKLFRLKTFAKEYDLDIFNENDYNLTSHETEDKVRLLANDLIDMYQEIPLVFVDLYRLQPSGAQTSRTDEEHMAFYQEIIEVLPPKWYQLFKYERQRRRIMSWPSTFDRSYSMRSNSLEMYENSISKLDNHESLKRHNKKSRAHLIRQSSVPESHLPTIETSSNSGTPIEGTRFRITKPTTIATEMFGNESKLI